MGVRLVTPDDDDGRGEGETVGVIEGVGAVVGVGVASMIDTSTGVCSFFEA